MQPDRMTRRRKPRLLSHPHQTGRALRSAFFAQAGESASRYGVRFERVLVQLWRSRHLARGWRLRNVIYLDDLVHAIACLDNDSLAWADLVERYERCMVRRCRASHDEIGSTILVRKVYADLRRECMERAVGAALQPALAEYVGHRPLRRWLTDRLMEAKNRATWPPQWCRVVPPIPALKNGTCDSPWPAPAPHSYATLQFRPLNADEPHAIVDASAPSRCPARLHADSLDIVPLGSTLA